MDMKDTDTTQGNKSMTEEKPSQKNQSHKLP